MYPELVTRPDLDVFLPPISNATVYIIGPMEYISDPTKKLSLRFFLFIIFILFKYFYNLIIELMTNAMEVTFLEVIFAPADPI